MAVLRVDGVIEAAFDWPGGSGRVTFDSTATSLDSILVALKEATGYRATLRPEAPGLAYP
ncbi:MAG: heavy-metal-associated domain-containing protein [Gemmatimonadota bacterium]